MGECFVGCGGIFSCKLPLGKSESKVKCSCCIQVLNDKLRVTYNTYERFSFGREFLRVVSHLIVNHFQIQTKHYIQPHDILQPWRLGSRRWRHANNDVKSKTSKDWKQMGSSPWDSTSHSKGAFLILAHTGAYAITTVVSPFTSGKPILLKCNAVRHHRKVSTNTVKYREINLLVISLLSIV